MKKNPLLLFSIIVLFLISCNNDKESKTTNQTSDSLKQYMDTVPQCDELLKLFHTVYLSNKHSIQLKKDISSLNGLTNKLPKNIYSIKKGSFGVADSMSVEVNDKNQIIAITAAYNYEPEFSNDTIYIHEQRKYNGMLCKEGFEYSYTAPDTLLKVCKWDAGNIAFELMEATIKGKKETYSVIFDKELCSKVMDTKDNSGKDISIELHRRKGWPLVK